MAKIPVHFHDEEFFEVQAKKTQARIQALSSGALTRDPDAPTIKPPKPLPPAVSSGPVRFEKVTHWQKKLANFRATHPGATEQDARDYYAAMKARSRAQQKEACHGA